MHLHWVICLNETRYGTNTKRIVMSSPHTTPKVAIASIHRESNYVLNCWNLSLLLTSMKVSISSSCQVRDFVVWGRALSASGDALWCGKRKPISCCPELFKTIPGTAGSFSRSLLETAQSPNLKRLYRWCTRALSGWRSWKFGPLRVGSNLLKSPEVEMDQLIPTSTACSWCPAPISQVKTISLRQSGLSYGSSAWGSITSQWCTLEP